MFKEESLRDNLINSNIILNTQNLSIIDINIVKIF